MHITPVGVPVYHMPAFFNPKGGFPEVAGWTYSKADGRQMVNHPPSISFGHVRDYPMDRFNRVESAFPAWARRSVIDRTGSWPLALIRRLRRS
jgi:hypothetical protein